MVSNQDSVYKQSPGHEELGLNIHRVPDLLVYEKNKEMGRVVESPVISLEKDLLSIATNGKYAPNYRAVSFLAALLQEETITAIDTHLAAWANQVKPIAKNASELNTYGYVLMAAREMDKAGVVFKLNTILYPGNANVFDSYGDYYMKSGNRLMARENYRKTLEIEPGNENARKMLEQLESQ
jgi:tetratricopeptide (TPR) repeat protein